MAVSLFRRMAAYIGKYADPDLAKLDPAADGGLNVSRASPAGDRRGDLREAKGVTIDADEDQWRPLTADANRNLSPLSKSRIREIAYYLWRTNPLANRTIELPLAFILAEGIKLTAKDDEAQGWLDTFWNDPVNRMPINLPMMARELALFGEQCWPTFVNEMNGAVRLGYLDPSQIATVVRDPGNARMVIGIVTKKDKKGVAKRYKVIVNGEDSELFSQTAQDIRATMTDGECFYFTANALQNGDGHSDLLPLADWLDGYDQVLIGELERVIGAKAYVWDVKLTGADQAGVDAKASTIAAPKPGAVRVHNETEEWTCVSPELNAIDSEASARLFRNHIMGGGTLPEHWFGGGGDVNRSTGESMSDPTFKMFTQRQQLLKYILEEIGAYVIRCRLAASGKDIKGREGDYKAQADFPEMVARDTTRYAAALQQVAVALVTILDRGLVTEEMAVRILQTIASRLGVDFDPKEELAAAQKEAGKNSEADLFATPPQPGDVKGKPAKPQTPPTPPDLKA